MHAGYRLADGGRIDVETDKAGRRVRLTLAPREVNVNGACGVETDVWTLTLSEARAVASALMGSAADC